jgi:hypothetical protein
LNDLSQTGLSQYLISTHQTINSLKCLAICTKMNQCGYILFKKNENLCLICNDIAFNYLISSNQNSQQNLIYKKNRKNPNFKLTNGLVNYWPFYQNYNDVIGTAHLYNPTGVEFVNDRNGISLSSVKLTNGFLKAPSGNYFGSFDFSVTVWANPTSLKAYDMLIDFGNGPINNNVIFTLTGQSLGKPEFFFLNTGTYRPSTISSQNLNLAQWTHIAYVLSKPNGYIYFNGVLKATISNCNYYPDDILRTSNFVGSSNNPADGSLNCIIDELKMFNRSLSQNEILFEMNNDYFI